MSMQKLLNRLRQFLEARAPAVTVHSEDRRKLTLVKARGDELTFLSEHVEEVGSEVVLCMSIHHSRFGRPQEWSLPLRVTASEALEPEADDELTQWRCTADLSGVPDNLRYLLERFYEIDEQEPEEEKPSEAVDLRGADRATRSFQVLSPDRKIKAMALDISSTGVRLQLAEALEPPMTMKLVMDFDVSSAPAIEVQAEVIWCQPIDEKAKLHRAGLRFVDPPAATARFIEKYLRYVENTGNDRLDAPPAKKELKVPGLGPKPQKPRALSLGEAPAEEPPRPGVVRRQERRRKRKR